MRTKRRQLVAFVFLLTILTTIACSAPPRAPDLGGLYSKLAQNEDPYRNPVILIPGILGSKLVDDIFDPELWRKNGWGLADAKQDKVLLISPIGWKQVFFLFSDHRNITNDPAFTDNLLYILLESPRDSQ